MNRKLALSTLIVAILIVGLGVYSFPWNGSSGGTSSTHANEELALVRPAFGSEIATMLTTFDSDAGMSIWLNGTTSAPLSLPVAMSAMVNIENITSDYVIGSITLTNVGFSSNDWPHCFVHKTGWIVVYYLKINSANPTTTGWLGKNFPMFKDSLHNWYDKDSHQLNDNLLHYALVYVSQALGVNPSSAQYYHFQYPSATTLEMAIKTGTYAQGTQTFNVKVPSTFAIDERSWSLYFFYTATFKIDSTTIYNSGYAPSSRSYGGQEITVFVLPPDVWHTVSISATYTTNDYATVCILILYH